VALRPHIDSDGALAAMRSTSHSSRRAAFGLHGDGMCDFVEKNRAVLRLLELAEMASGSAGNDPFSWPNNSIRSGSAGTAAQFT